MDRAQINRSRCYQCGGPFGLIRHRFAFKKFCSQNCLIRFRSGEKKLNAARERYLRFLDANERKRS